jgi:hypothetical protein
MRYNCWMLDEDSMFIYQTIIEDDNVWDAGDKFIKKNLARRPAGVHALQIFPSSSEPSSSEPSSSEPSSSEPSSSEPAPDLERASLSPLSGSSKESGDLVKRSPSDTDLGD